MEKLNKDMKGLGVSKGKGDNKQMARRRLSIATGGAGLNVAALDGYIEQADEKTKRTQSMDFHPTSPKAGTGGKSLIKATHRWSHVGYVPFNNSKVNQDRAVVNTDLDDDKCFFAVMDGHGTLGHEVSEYSAKNLQKWFMKDKAALEADPKSAIERAFIECNTKLVNSSIDCTYSGTTVVVVYMHGTTLYGCNAGDSRAVMARKTEKGLVPVPLSYDQKPEKKSERDRIIKSGGRVHACKGHMGEDIGPQRVWLKHQDVPGLAMTRSFGDTVAASVGVIPKPEVEVIELTPEDQFMILASDGVWEFIENDEAIQIVAECDDPEQAIEELCTEATRRWKQEEEVVDDITAVVVYFKGSN